MGVKDYSVLISVVHMDEYYSIDSWPEEGDKTEMTPMAKQPGGRVANTACVMSSLGDEVKFFDVLSRDATDSYLLEDLQQYGVDIDEVAFEDGIVNSKCIIILSRTDKTCLKIVNPKPQIELTTSQREMFYNAKYIYCAMGFHEIMKNPKECFASFVKHGASLAMDIEEGFKCEDQDYYFALSEVLFFNQFGFYRNAEAYGGEENYLKYIFSKGVKVVAITMGKDGCKIVTPDRKIIEPAYYVKVVDPCGAGDTFNGAFLHGMLQGWSIERCAKFAVGAAGYCVSTFGARSAAVNEDAINNFMSTHKCR